MTVKRGTSNTNDRGSSHARRKRKQWLLDTFGDGITAPCHFCKIMLDFSTITVDRIIPGCEGGRYIRSNIRPACMHDNASEGSKLGLKRKREKENVLRNN